MNGIEKVFVKSQHGFTWSYWQDQESLLDDLGVEEMESDYKYNIEEVQ